MLISQQHKAVILRSRDPNRILSIILTARLIHYQGQPLVAVPHRVAEARVLNNLNIRVPSPIRFHYDWPSRYPEGPFKAQLETAAFLTMYPRSFCLNEMGTGKTLAGLWAADYLMRRKVIQSTLVVCPLSTIHETWEAHIREHFLTRTVAVLHGSAAKRRRLLAQPHDIYIINHDGVEVVRDELIAHKRIGLVIIDELAEFSNARTGKWEAMKDVVQPREWVWGFTGTPTPQAPTDAWAQVKLIKPENAPKRFTRFRDATMLQQSTYKWVPRDTALEVVHTAMQPSIRFSRAECVDLPECTYVSREAALTPEQTKAYKELLNQYATEYAEDKITAANEGVKRGKLIQVLCGAVYPDAGGVLHLPCGPRLQVVEECIREAPSKVIVFAPLVAVVQMLLAWLGKQYETAAIWGDTPVGQRKEILHDFQRTDRYRFWLPIQRRWLTESRRPRRPPASGTGRHRTGSTSRPTPASRAPDKRCRRRSYTSCRPQWSARSTSGCGISRTYKVSCSGCYKKQGAKRTFISEVFMDTDVSKLVAGYRQLRDKKGQLESALKAKVAPITEMMEKIEARLLQLADAQNVKSFSTADGTAYKYKASSVRVKDWPSFLEYVKANDEWELLTRGASKNEVIAHAAETPVPGIEIFQEVCMGFRAPTK